MKILYVLLILIVVGITAYNLLSYYKLIPVSWGTLPDLWNRGLGIVQGYYDSIKSYPFLAPILTAVISVAVGGVVAWVKNRSTATKVSTIQNENLQTQNSMTQSYQQSVTSLTDTNKTLQTQLDEAQAKLSSLPNVTQLETVYVQQQKEIENWKLTVQTLQAELDRQKILVHETVRVA